MNSNLWNVRNLEPPPRNTYKTKSQDVDIHTLREVLTEAYSTFKHQKSLHAEAAMLSRCIYRMKLKFRSDKGLKAMEKMNRALLQYLRMNIPQLLETFHGMIPQKYTRETYLPTLNMLQYVLVRIQGLSQLMIRVVESAKAAAEFMELRISIGHLWKVAFVCLGVISRIFVLTKELAKFCCKFYSQLLPFTHKLKNVGFNWLASDYSFPPDLKTWLNIEWLDKDEVPVKKPKKLTIPTIFDIVDSDSEVEFCGEYADVQDDIEITDEYVEVKDGEENVAMKRNKWKIEEAEDVKENAEATTGSNNKQILGKQNKVSILEIEEDIGEVIRPNDVLVQHKNINSKKNRHKQKLKQPKATAGVGNESVQHLIAKINTLKDLKKFEKDFQNIQKTHSNVFKRMDRLQINMLQNSLKKWTTKARKHQGDHSKINLYISKATELLKSNLM